MIETIEQPVAPTTTEDASAAQQHRQRLAIAAHGSSPKPLLRGCIHAAAAIAALLLVATFVESAPLDRRLPLLVFGGSLVELYAVSATFHMVRWQGKMYTYMRLLDHSSIFVMIAATAAAFAAMAPIIWLRSGLIMLIWSAAAAGIGAKWLHPRMSRILSTLLYLGMGWIGGGAWFILSRSASASNGFSAALLPLVLAGVLHTLGAVIYARRLPNWWPAVFGYHELFHILVVLGNTAVSVAVLHVTGTLPSM